VPKVLGKSLSVAKRKIKAAGCAVGQIKRKKDKSKAGKVIAQTRAPKLVLPTGSRVGLTVGTK
jgi:beta-lactam-binding protein with PASTA domain